VFVCVCVREYENVCDRHTENLVAENIALFNFKVLNFCRGCTKYGEGNVTDIAQLYCVYCDNSYMFRLIIVAILRLLMSEV
jgi:hypothetical protein